MEFKIPSIDCSGFGKSLVFSTTPSPQNSNHQALMFPCLPPNQDAKNPTLPTRYQEKFQCPRTHTDKCSTVASHCDVVCHRYCIVSCHPTNRVGEKKISGRVATRVSIRFALGTDRQRRAIPSLCALNISLTLIQTLLHESYFKRETEELRELNHRYRSLKPIFPNFQKA